MPAAAKWNSKFFCKLSIEEKLIGSSCLELTA